MSNKYEKTFCNPISLPDYAYAGKDWGFLSEFLPVTGRWAGHDAKFDAPVRSYRSLSDPDVMFYDGKWYLYASADCCYSSADMVSWKRHDIIPHRFCAEGLTKEGRELTAHEKRLYEIGVALTAVPFRGKIYMTHSSTNAIWVSDTPYGPFEKVGAFERPSKEAIKKFENNLKAARIPVTVRVEKGFDSSAACGQLRSSAEARKRKQS